MLQFAIKTLGSYITFACILLGMITVNLYKPMTTLTLQLQDFSMNLYFTGVVNPLETTRVPSPFEGKITQMFVKYGDKITKGQPLFVIQANQQEADFRRAIEEYVKAKARYQNTLFIHKANDELFKLGVLAKSNFLTSQDELKNSELSVWGAEQSVRKVLANTDIQFSQIENLSVEEIPKIQPLLTSALEGIKVLAPEDGLLLFPTKTLIGTEGELGAVSVGSSVKLGQILAVIASSRGLKLDISVNESNFQDIIPGKKVTVSGPAFSEYTLTGEIASINHQGNSIDINSPTTYTAYINIPQLTEEQRKRIQIGMAAEVVLTKVFNPMIRVPLTAVIQKNGEYYVSVLQQNTVKDVPVVPGITDETSVEIIKGLKEGDTIVIPN